VTVSVSIPRLAELRLEHVILDVNGTLTNRGELLDGVEARLGRLGNVLDVRLVSADTFGTLDAIAARMNVSAVRVSTGEDKLWLLDELGRERCAVIGNGSNDALALEAAAIGFAVIGPEGASAAALRSADVLCASVTDALDLLLDPKALSATLRR
jgi:soluble P-type ATPase